MIFGIDDVTFFKFRIWRYYWDSKPFKSKRVSYCYFLPKLRNTLWSLEKKCFPDALCERRQSALQTLPNLIVDLTCPLVNLFLKKNRRVGGTEQWRHRGTYLTFNRPQTWYFGCPSTPKFCSMLSACWTPTSLSKNNVWPRLYPKLNYTINSTLTSVIWMISFIFLKIDFKSK